MNELGDYTDLLTGEPAALSAITIPAGGFLWMLCDFTKEDIEHETV